MKKTMDYKFLNKVLGQIVSETTIDHDKRVIRLPYQPSSFTLAHQSLYFPYVMSRFSTHCKSIYGLNDDEISYVWNEYREIIIDKINNG